MESARDFADGESVATELSPHPVARQVESVQALQRHLSFPLSDRPGSVQAHSTVLTDENTNDILGDGFHQEFVPTINDSMNGSVQFFK